MAEHEHTISFEPEDEQIGPEPEENPISFDTTPDRGAEATTPSTDGEVQARAEKMDVALQGYAGSSTSGANAIADQIRGGAEDTVRSQLLHKQALAIREAQVSFLTEASVQSGKQASPEAVKQFMELTSKEMSDPRMIAESMFAKEMMAGMRTEAASKQENFVAHEGFRKAFERSVWRKEYYQKKLEEVETIRGERGIGETIMNFAGAYLTPLRLGILVKDAIKDSGAVGPANTRFLLSGNLTDQSTFLNIVGDQTYLDTVDGVVNYLLEANPEAAASWLSYMLNRSTSNDYWTDVFDVMDISSVIDIPFAIGATTRRLLMAGKLKKQVGKAIVEATGSKPQALGFAAPKGTSKRGGETYSGISGDNLTVDQVQDLVDRNKGKVPDEQAPDITAMEDFLDSKFLEGPSPKDTPKPLTAGTPTGPAGREHLKALIDLSQTLGRRSRNVPDIHAVKGDTGAAAVQRGLKEVKAGMFTQLAAVNTVASVKRLLRDMPMLWTKNQIFTDIGKLANEQHRRITAILDQNLEIILKAATETPLVHGKPDDVLAAGMKATLAKYKDSYRGHSTDILDIYDATPLGDTTNVTTFGILIGRHGKPFTGSVKEASEEATEFAKNLGLQGFRIVQKGENTFINVFMVNDETATMYRNQLALKNNTPINYRSATGNLIFSADDVLSDVVRQAAGTAQASLNNYNAAIQRIAEPIRKGLSSLQKKDMEHYLDIQKIHENFDRDGKFINVGRVDATINEFSVGFEKNIGRMPEPNEILAYFTSRQINEFELLVNNFGQFRDKSRMGIEQHKILIREDAGTAIRLENEGIITKKEMGSVQEGLVLSEGIEGKRIPFEDFPILKTDERLLFYDPYNAADDGKPFASFLNSGDLNDADRATKFSEWLKDGGEIIQLNKEGQAALARMFPNTLKGDIPDYLITKRSTSQPVELSQIRNSPGGHHIYPQGSFMKQGDITATEHGLRYAGDRAIINVPHHPDAVALEKPLNDLRKNLEFREVEVGGSGGRVKLKLVIKDEAAFTAALAKTPFSKKEYMGMYDGPSQYLNLDTPIYATRDGVRTTELTNSYADGINGQPVRVRENPLDQGVSSSYSTRQGRPLDATINKGTEENPLYNITHAKFLAPFATMQRALDVVGDGRFMKDFQYRAQEQFLSEFGDLFVDGIDAARANPRLYALTGELRDDGVDALRLHTAKGQQRVFRQILGTETSRQVSIRQFYQRFIDALYTKHGEKAVRLVPDSALPFITDPGKYIRNMAFHEKLGLFNPLQLFLQGNGAVNMVAIAGPKIGWRATPAAINFMRLGFTNRPEIIAEMAKINSKLGMGVNWEPKHFIEAYNELSVNGWQYVKGEVADRDVQSSSYFNRSMAGRVLDAGESPFQAGEKFNRVMGYSGAYLKWRDANPTALFDRAAKAKVLDIARMYAGRMTRQSASAWQKGFLAVPTQFYAYTARIGDLMLPQMLGGSPALSGMEKLQMFGVYSLVYGVPTTIGTASMVVPFYDMMREELLLRGYANPDTGSETVDFVLNSMQNGIVQGIFQASGVSLNFGQRYSPGAIPVFRDVFKGKQSLFDALTGVSGSVVGDVVSTVYPLLMDVVDSFAGDAPGYEILAYDLVQLTKNISSLNSAVRFYVAISLERYYTRNATLLNDQPQGWLSATLRALTGLTRADTADDFLRLDLTRLKKEAQREGMKEISIWLRHANLPGTSPELFKALVKRSGHLSQLLDLTSRQRNTILNNSFSGENLAKLVGADFAKTIAGSDIDLEIRILDDAARVTKGNK